MKKYDSYKDSEIEWIGEVPSHWDVDKLNRIFQINTGFTPSTGNNEFYENGKHDWITIRDLEGKYVSESKTKLTDIAIKGKTIIPKGSLLYSFKLSVGQMAFTTKEIYTNEAIFSVFPSEKLNLNYYYYLLDRILIHNSNENIYGAKILNQELIKAAKLLVPSEDEQTTIANYLDHKTTQIDTLISKKQQFITLLQEERIAVINQAVTKGLNPNVPMKDSGIEWLGEIPEHWEVTKIKYQFNVQGGGTPSKENLSYWNGNIPWVSPKDMKLKDIIDTIDKTNLLGISNSSSKIIESESLLMVVRSGILQRTIPIGINKVAVSLNQDIKSFTSKGRHSIHLLYYFIKGWEKHLLEDWSKEGATVESIEMEYLLNFSLPMPAIEEQRDIVQFLENEETKRMHTINLLAKEIELMKEYKIALISEVVTGKVDVRNEILN